MCEKATKVNPDFEIWNLLWKKMTMVAMIGTFSLGVALSYLDSTQQMKETAIIFLNSGIEKKKNNILD